jgi:hypothetical protein
MSILNNTQEAMKTFDDQLNTVRRLDGIKELSRDEVHSEILYCQYEYNDKRYQATIEELADDTLKLMEFHEA